MIKKFYVTGDIHGNPASLEFCAKYSDNPTEEAYIILGDAGLNFYLNKTDKKTKQRLEDTGSYFYCVRGNHEERPENIETMFVKYDDEVEGEVYMEAAYPHIRYFKDGNIYKINGKRVLVIGGAYSVDKNYRQLMGYPWFKDEMLTESEMDEIMSRVYDEEFDIIMSHTCPISWEPNDLFLPIIDQNEVDKSMEIWLDEVKNKTRWTVWLFGHYHRDRYERPGVEMFYRNIVDIEDIWYRWQHPEEIEEILKNHAFGTQAMFSPYYEKEI